MNDYSCECDPGFTGKRCELRRFERIPSDYAICNASAVSGDGKVVVGHVLPGPQLVGRGLLWTVDGGFDDPFNYEQAVAYGVDFTGTVVVGTGRTATESGPFRWVKGQGMVFLDAQASEAYAVSADGKVVAGKMLEAVGGGHMFRWTAANGVEDLGSLEEGYPVHPSGINANGTMIVGRAQYVSVTSGTSAWAAFRWTPSERFQRLTSDYEESGAWAVSANGTVIVGSYRANDGQSRPFRWTLARGFAPLDVGSLRSANANAVNEDGTVVVGSNHSDNEEEEGWIWNETQGVRLLRDVLAEHGVDASAWRGLNPKGISADGSVVVGVGGVEGHYSTQSWIARLGDP